MNNFIQMAGATLRKGFNTLSSFWRPSGSGVAGAGAKLGASVASGFFPAEQREKIVPSNVSVNPVATFLGYRPTAPQAETLRQPFLGWVSSNIKSSYDKAAAAFRNFVNTKKTAKALNTLRDTALQTAQAGIASVGTSLVNFFQEKWGLTPRPSEVNDTVYSNESQSNAISTKPSGLMDFFGLQPSQPSGSYFIGNPQTEPMPASPIISTGDYPPQGTATSGGNIMPILMIGGVLFAAYFFMKRRA